MALTLKSSGQALDLVACLVVDDDGTIKDLCGNSITVDPLVTTGTGTWKGQSRKYLSTGRASTYVPRNVVWNNPRPGIFITPGAAGVGVFIAAAGATSGSGSANSIIDLGDQTSGGSGRGILIGTSSGTIYAGFGGTIITGRVLTRDNTPFSIALNYKYGTNRELFFGTEDGPLVSDAADTAPNYGPTGAVVQSIGGPDGQGSQPYKPYIVAVFNSERTKNQYDALHADWQAELFTAAGPTAPPAPTVNIATARTSNSAQINWNNVAGETGFDVQLETPNLSGNWVTVSGSPVAADVTSLVVTGLSPGTSYRARVKALGPTDSAYTISAAFTTLVVVKGVRTVLKMVSGGSVVPYASITGLSVAWFDTRPGSLAAPVAVFSAESTDASGQLEFASGTALALGEKGYMIVMNPSSGLMFAGEVAVVDING